MSARRNDAITLDAAALRTAYERGGNRSLLLQALLACVDCTATSAEQRLVPGRRWRADLAWPSHRVAIELQGGIWTRGHHVRGREYEHDCEKMLHAAAQGWRVLPLTWTMLVHNPQEVARLLNEIIRCTEPAHHRPA